MARGRVGQNAVMAAFLAALTACAPGAGPSGSGSGVADSGADQGATPVPAATSVRLVDRDVEAPEVFQVTDQALWDGRPSLGGVWVASPDATDPERVILRNTTNGRFVIGALFRRERDNPGPALQISSDAAAALGLLAGQPAALQVTALRREEAATAPPDATKPILDAAEAIATTPLEGLAGAAIDKADAASQGATKLGATAPGATQPGAGATRPAVALQPAAAAIAANPPPTANSPAVAPQPASGAALIQIGIFSVEANARRAVDALTQSGVTATQRREESQGKPFWSVTARGDATTLAAVKAAGFADAYILKR